MISVVTIVHDRATQLANLIDGLRNAVPMPDELVVVDMGSNAPVGGPAQAGARPQFPVVVIGLDDGGGALPLARARNAGAAAARGDRLVFLDVDCIPAPDLVGAYRAAPGGCLACAPVRYLREGWDRHGVDLDPVHLRDASDPHRLRPAPADDVSDARYDLFWSLSFGVDRSTFAFLGGFDERYAGYGAEDTDLAWTARRLGVPLLWLANGGAFHQWHPSPSPPVQHLTAIVANARTFHDKWGEWPMSGWLTAFAAEGLIEWAPDAGVIALAG